MSYGLESGKLQGQHPGLLPDICEADSCPRCPPQGFLHGSQQCGPALPSRFQRSMIWWAEARLVLLCPHATPVTCTAPRVIQRDEEDEEGGKRRSSSSSGHPKFPISLHFHIHSYIYIFSFLHKTSASVWRWLKNGTH